MKFVFHTICISPHQLPWASEMVRLCGDENFVYLHDEPLTEEREKLGWSSEVNDKWARCSVEDLNLSSEILTSADFLVSGIREFDVFEKRLACGRLTIYSSERWFKPPLGIVRLLHPKFFGMARRMVKLLRSRNNFYYFPIGILAAQDMVRLCGLFSGKLSFLFRSPKLKYESCPCGKIEAGEWSMRRFGMDKMRMWGYFVEPSKIKIMRQPKGGTLRILWVGRLLALKRVDTLLRAVKACADKGVGGLRLTIVGSGPEETRLKIMVLRLNLDGIVEFRPPVHVDEIRRIMQEHDVYVLPSNGYEGWGAVVSEALEEGMEVLGSDAAGSSLTMLTSNCLFEVGDWRRLAQLLMDAVTGVRYCTGIGSWTAKSAAMNLMECIRGG